MKDVAAQGVALPATHDEMIVRMWLHGRQPKTILAYQADAARFLGFVGRPLSTITLADLQAYDASMTGNAHASRARRLASVKSLLSFACRLGFLPLNPGAALRIEKPQTTTAERILSKEDVARMIGAENDPRRAALLRLLYVSGLRASEVCGLRWRDMIGGEKKGGEARVLGKGGKLRSVPLPADLWRELVALAPSTRPDAPVVPGRNGGPLDYAALHRAVKRAARRAGVNDEASAHWLRHAHASHSLDNGCRLHVLQASLGHASLATTSRYVHARPGEGSAAFIKA